MSRAAGLTGYNLLHVSCAWYDRWQ